ncbi:hypothetical protein C8R45DRAFT_1132464 [Mycena sanguinolenta]|nr:hypothetical protein C8R45DRAFT_1132464 [Mycena sanguinolenta]
MAVNIRKRKVQLKSAIESPGLSLSLGLEALSEGLGLGLRFLKPKPAQAGPKPGLPGQAGPLDSLTASLSSLFWTRMDVRDVSENHSSTLHGALFDAYRISPHREEEGDGRVYGPPIIDTLVKFALRFASSWWHVAAVSCKQLTHLRGITAPEGCLGNPDVRA